jgi:hypothetical protein
MNTAPSLDKDFQVKSLETLIRELPADLRSEVRNFVEFLLVKKAHAVSGASRHDQTGAQREDTTVDLHLTSFPLHGTVLRYDDPFAPVAESEWEALQ